MAAYMRSVICLVSTERNVFLTRGCGVIVESRRFVRGLRRKPVKVLFPENDSEKVVKPQSQPAAGPNVRREREVTATRQPEESDFIKAKRGKDAPVTVTKDYLDGLRFERALPGDKRLSITVELEFMPADFGRVVRHTLNKRLVSVARSRTFREHQGKILLEGRRLICDALNAGANPQMVFFSTMDRLRELPLDKLKRATLVKVKFEDIKIWSDLVAPQGVIAIFSRPDPSRMNFTNRGHSVPLSLICDNIRDPGNLGTMLRCAAAAGCRDVLLTKGCVDTWEPKVLRAAMGAHFRLPIHPNLSWDDIEKYLPKPVMVHVADNRCGEAKESKKPSKAGDFGWVSTKRVHNSVGYEEHDSDSDSDGECESLSLPSVETKLYHQRWAQGPTALVIGGETHGLSLEAVELAEKMSGHRLFIPVVPNVDSLNSAMAASILLFEGRKQLSKLTQTSGKKWKPKAEQQLSLREL